METKHWTAILNLEGKALIVQYPFFHIKLLYIKYNFTHFLLEIVFRSHFGLCFFKSLSQYNRILNVLEFYDSTKGLLLT